MPALRPAHRLSPHKYPIYPPLKESPGYFSRTLLRLASHGFVLSVAIAAVVASSQGVAYFIPQQILGGQVELPKWPQSPHVLLPLDTEQQNMRALPVLVTTTAASGPSNDYEGRQSIVTYTVQSGDTLSEIASRYSVTTQTLIWANTISNPNSLKPGSELKIPPTSGVLHVVEEGDTLVGLAAKYNVDVDNILGFQPNKVKNPNALVLGQALTIPGGVKPVELSVTRLAATQPVPAPTAAPALPPQPQATNGAPLQWPTFGPIFAFFDAGHRGLDISPPYGTPIYAAEAGVVAWVQYINYGYGYHFLIDHGNGFQTLYAHESEILVQPGERVVKGQHIGRVGTTGLATGPHLHFEVHYNGVAVNPLNYLPR